MSIENNPAIEILNTVVTTKGGNGFVFIVAGILTLTGIISVIVFIVDWWQTGSLMDGFGWFLGMTILIGTISGLNLYAMKHPVEIISYEVRFTDPDHFSLTEYEKLEENYIVSREGKIYTLKERVDKDD